MRYDITVFSKEHLTELIPILKEHNLQKINLTHKHTTISNLEAAKAIKQQIPSIDITAHLSLKYCNNAQECITYCNAAQETTKKQKIF
jgi:hypothetical protein